MKRQLNKPILFCGLIALAGIGQFGVSVANAIDATGDEFRMSEQFLSDLGRSDHPAAAPIFNRGVIRLGLSLIPFFAVMPWILQRFRWVVMTAGIASAGGLIGIGMTPYDLFPVGHQMSLVFWIAPMLVVMVTFLVGAFIDGFATLWLAIGTGLCLFAVWGYATAGIRGQFVFQKVVAVLAVCWFAVVFLSVLVTTVSSVSSRRQIVESQARRYLHTITRNHRKRRG